MVVQSERREKGGIAACWGRLRLHVQLAILSAGLLMVTIFATTAYNINEQIDDYVISQRTEAVTFARNVAVTGVYQVLDNDLAALEELLLNVASFPAVRDVRVIDNQGRLLGHVVRDPGGQPAARYDHVAEPPPEDGLASVYTDLATATIVVWQPIHTSSRIGWVRLVSDLHRMEAIKARCGATISSSAVPLYFWILYCFFSYCRFQCEHWPRAPSLPRG